MNWAWPHGDPNNLAAYHANNSRVAHTLNKNNTDNNAAAAALRLALYLCTGLGPHVNVEAGYGIWLDIWRPRAHAVHRGNTRQSAHGMSYAVVHSVILRLGRGFLCRSDAHLKWKPEEGGLSQSAR